LKKKLFWRTNDEIAAPELRVIDKEGRQIGVKTRAEALDLAKKSGLDLVEIAPMAKPPVVQVIEFGKFRYKEEKKARAQNKAGKPAELKEIRFSPFIAEGDYQTRFRRMSEFLSAGHKIRVVVVFKGRQMGSKKFGYALVDRILNELGERVVVDMKPKFLGRHLAMVVSPLKKSKKQREQESKKNAETKNKKKRDEKI
jgi:translation initiation factor IF-3